MKTNPSKNARRLIAAGFLLAIPVVAAHAGFTGLTWFSRANCALINESITWDLTKPHRLWTGTVHYRNGLYQHEFNSGWVGTWGDRRSRAGDTESGLGWKVFGYHWEYTLSLGVFKLGESVAIDCNLGEW